MICQFILYLKNSIIATSMTKISVILLQSVPPKWGHIQTQFSIFKNHKFQKVRPVLKTLQKNLSDGTLKLSKIKLEVFLNSILKKCVKLKKNIETSPLKELQRGFFDKDKELPYFLK
jgi:hypothetical protein